MNNHYDSATHSYYIDGVLVPSATQILNICGVVNNRFFTEGSRARGTAVHSCCHFFAEGDLDWSSVDERIVGYVRAYEAAIKTLDFKPTLCEIPQFSIGLQYGVTPDQVDESKKIIVELKTGYMRPWTSIQTALQAMALWPTDYSNSQRIGVQLGLDRKFRIEYFDEPSDFEVAISMIRVAHWSLRKKIK